MFDAVDVWVDPAKVCGSLTLIVQAFRHLNAVTVPKIVSVPKNEADEAKKGN